MSKIYDLGICCPQEYQGTWKNKHVTVKISPLNITVITQKEQTRLYGKVLKEYYDYGYSVSYQCKKVIYYLTITKGFVQDAPLFFKLTKNEKGKVKNVFNLKLELC